MVPTSLQEAPMSKEPATILWSTPGSAQAEPVSVRRLPGPRWTASRRRIGSETDRMATESTRIESKLDRSAWLWLALADAGERKRIK
eukprot:3657411-Pyramimonas_sp.AAC.1